MGISAAVILQFVATMSAVVWARGAIGSRGVSMDAATVAPHFLSHGQTFRSVVGDTLVLPCEVEDLGDYVLLWRRGTAVLTAATLMVTRDPRFRLVDGYNLQISDVRPQDAGDYGCQISENADRTQIHTVEILVPPSIRMSPADGELKARKGGTVTLECKASGNPVPSIIWTRKDNTLPTGEKSVEGFSITLEKIDRHQAGVYQCTANNGVGDPVTVDMTLDVLYPPEIEVERSWVHSGEGYEAQLVCIVHGEPQPEGHTLQSSPSSRSVHCKTCLHNPIRLMWYQDNLMLDPTERRSMETRGNKHTLTIRDVQATDFGNYSCVAENSLGRAKKYMELSGRPGPAQYRSSPFGRSWDSYNLTWQVESYPPLEEVRVLYRRLMVNDTYNQPDKWHDISLRPPQDSDTFTHVMSYNIRGLSHGSMFEAIVQAKNRYGWNEVSDMFQFHTRGAGEHRLQAYGIEPEVQDLGLIANANSEAVPLWHRLGAAVVLMGAACSLILV
ncbi:lachesin-like isoform X1 [Schistocerca serialis cubense]|uniref:lachesin-like isoform X1 n=1 Tax=Schistocerca serialis cubense TaxID=2023355 RepID=UPI00214E8ED2|nr:lachesin-like isoform X1 [Schistocerca serialis cubense]